MRLHAFESLGSFGALRVWPVGEVGFVRRVFGLASPQAWVRSADFEFVVVFPDLILAFDSTHLRTPNTASSTQHQ
jgi:hypothetical protein